MTGYAIVFAQNRLFDATDPGALQADLSRLRQASGMAAITNISHWMIEKSSDCLSLKPVIRAQGFSGCH